MDTLALCSGAPTSLAEVTVLDLPLTAGWNLVSTYVNPFVTDAAVVQQPISGTYAAILGFDEGAQSYYPDLPAGINTLTSLDGEHGYWIKVVGEQGIGVRSQGSATPAEAVTLRVAGTTFAEDWPLVLDEGWNLVSYLPQVSLPVTVALQTIDGLYTAVLGYAQGALSYYPSLPSVLNTLQVMAPLHGYWIKMSEAATLIYPTSGGQQTARRSATVGGRRSAPNRPE